MPHKFSIKIISLLENPGRTVTEKLFFGFQLLVNFQSRHEPDSVVVSLGCLFAGDVTNFLFCFSMVASGVEVLFHFIS